MYGYYECSNFEEAVELTLRIHQVPPDSPPLLTYLVRNDGRLVHDDVHEPEHVGPVLEVEQEGGVAVNVATLGDDLDANCLGD